VASTSCRLTKATAYRIARMVEEKLGWTVAGWKIAATGRPKQDAGPPARFSRHA